MSVEHHVDHWGTSPGDPVLAALAGIETALGDLPAMGPGYWRTSQKKDILVRLERLKAQRDALSLRVLAVAGDIAEEAGDRPLRGCGQISLSTNR